MQLALKSLIAAGVVASAVSLGGVGARAMSLPTDPAVATAGDLAAPVENVRMVCNPWGCHWAPDRWGWGGYGPRPYRGYRPYWGGHRHWRRW